MRDYMPLPHEWMVVSIIGFLVSWMYVYGTLARNYLALGNQALANATRQWGVAFMIFFIILLVASLYTMDRAGKDDEHLTRLAIGRRR